MSGVLCVVLLLLSLSLWLSTFDVSSALQAFFSFADARESFLPVYNIPKTWHYL